MFLGAIIETRGEWSRGQWWRGKWRQLYLNNNKNLKINKNHRTKNGKWRRLIDGQNGALSPLLVLVQFRHVALILSVFLSSSSLVLAEGLCMGP